MFVNTPAQQVSSAALVLTVAVTAWKGARPERATMLLITAAWLLTPFVELRTTWRQPQWGIFAVDSLTLAGLVLMSLHFKRHWLVVASGFQALAVLTHLAFLINPRDLYRGYLYTNFAIGYLLLGSVLGGICVERKMMRKFDLRNIRHR